MMKTRLRVLTALAAGIAGMPVVSPAQETDCNIVLNYENADIRTVIDEVAIRTGRLFVLDPQVKGKVTVKSSPDGGICAEDIWDVFQTILRSGDFVAVSTGDMKYRIIPAKKSVRSAGPVGRGQGGGADTVTQVIHVEHVDAREVLTALAQVTGVNAVITSVRSGNAVLVVDTAANIRRIEEIVSKLDQDPLVERWITLEHASAFDIVPVVTQMESASVSASGSGKSAKSASFSILPVRLNNTVYVRAKPAVMERIESIIDLLDRPDENPDDLSVVYLDHASAENLAPLLSGLADNARDSSANTQQSRGNPSVSFDAPTNALIIRGDEKTRQMLLDVVSKLDIRRAQVLVEAIIVDVSEQLERDLGFQYFLTGNGRNGVPFMATNYPSGPGLLGATGAALLSGDVLSGVLGDDTASALSDTLAQETLNSLAGLQGGTAGGGLEFGNGNIFGAILNMLQTDTDSNILSTPSIVTLNNETARLQVGQEIPVTTGEQIGSDFENAFRTVSREEVGIILEVTPQINKGDVVTLEISQEISSVFGAAADTSDFITDKRVITTTALVDDGALLVVGGLIRQGYENVESKVPLLGDIPGAGALFRTSAKDRNRTNLMVFIRPTIIRDAGVAASVTERKYDYIRARELFRDGKGYAGMDSVINDITGMAAPAGFTGKAAASSAGTKREGQ